jgi:hypothetical protein
MRDDSVASLVDRESAILSIEEIAQGNIVIFAGWHLCGYCTGPLLRGTQLLA